MSTTAVATAFSVSALLRSVWPSMTAKQAARVAGISHRTVEDWLSERCSPNAATLARMVARNDELRLALISQLQGKHNDQALVDRRVAGHGTPCPEAG